MAGKQLGKFRQWAGEVIAVRDKTIVTDEFRELEHDIELRRRGLTKLSLVSGDYHHAISKKKETVAVDGEEKLLAIDALGIVMMQHGEEFGDDSAFGTSLVTLGRAHCQVATLQDAFALRFDDTYLASLHRTEDEIKEYQAQRKKLDSRRLTYDAAITKAEKVRNSKKEKEKDREEAEDEYAKAKARYEETLEDVRARMFAIQENELEQLRALTTFLDDETRFVEQYLEVLKEAKASWIDEATLTQMETARRRRPVPHSVDGVRYGSVRSIKSVSRPGSNSSDSNDDAPIPEGRHSRTLSMHKSDANGKSSRPQSRASRKRANSVNDNTSEKELDGEKDKKDKRRSVAGWATSKMSSLTHRGKNHKSKGKIDTLMGDRDDVGSDDEYGHDGSFDHMSRTSSLPATSRISPTKIRPSISASSTPTIAAMVPRGLKAPPQQPNRKLAIALHDFAAGSSDELSFRVGDRIVVVSEVLDGWWMGELDGKTGLFPTTYTEVVNEDAILSKPPLPRRPSPIADPSPIPSDDEPGRQPRWLTTTHTGNFSVQSDDDDHPFGDSYVAPIRTTETAFYAESITSSVDEYADAEDERLVNARDERPDANPRTYSPASPPTRPPIPSRATSMRKAPPPPPPRRSTITVPPGNAPPVPLRPSIARSTTSSQSTSTNASFVTVATATALPTPELKTAELTFSPFDSPKDAVFPMHRGCDEFKQNPFKAPGVCANCFKMHA